MNLLMPTSNNGIAIIDSNFTIDDLEIGFECKVIVEFNYAYMGGVDEVEVTKIIVTHEGHEVMTGLLPQLQWKSDLFAHHIRNEIKRLRLENEREREAEERDHGLYIGLAANEI